MSGEIGPHELEQDVKASKPLQPKELITCVKGF